MKILAGAGLINQAQNFIWLMFLPKHVQELAAGCSTRISLERVHEISFREQQICIPEAIAARSDAQDPAGSGFRKLQQRMKQDLQGEDREESGLTMSSCIISTETTWGKNFPLFSGSL